MHSVKKRENFGSQLKASSEENENTDKDNRSSESKEIFRLNSDSFNMLTPVDEEEEKSALVDLAAIEADSVAADNRGT